MRRKRTVFVVLVGVLVLLLPWSARADQIPRHLNVEATVTNSVAPPGNYVSVFDGTGLGGGVSITVPTPHGRLAVAVENVTLHMSVAAQQCCTVHSFVLGPWSGIWTLDGMNGDTISGTTTGVIEAGCVSDPTGFSCLSPPTMGPGVNFALTVTGGTGRYAGASGTGTLSGSQTPVPVPPPTAQALFVGQVNLTLN